MYRMNSTPEFDHSLTLGCDSAFLELLINFEDPFKASAAILAIEHERVGLMLARCVVKSTPELARSFFTSYSWIAEVAREVGVALRDSVTRRCVSPAGVLAEWSVTSRKCHNPESRSKTDAVVSQLHSALLAASRSHNYRFNRSVHEEYPHNLSDLVDLIVRLERERIFEYLDIAVWALADVPGRE